MGSIATQSLLVWIVVGLIAGWLASRFVGGRGGIFYYLILGLLGAFVGGFLVSLLHISIMIVNPIVTEVVIAAVGAIVVVLIARAIR